MSADATKTEQWLIEHTVFTYPEDMGPSLQKVFEGSYNLEPRKWRPDLPHRPKVLDLGANVGAFSIFATKRWPGCTVEAFEPVPELFALLKENTKHLKEIHVNQLAVAKDATPRPFHLGLNNNGEGSLYADINAQGDAPNLVVDCVAATTLPQADIIKIDIEGAEWEFLDNYPFLADAALIAIEYHRDGDKEKLEEKLKPLGFVLATARVSQNDPGELIFARQKDIVVRK